MVAPSRIAGWSAQWAAGLGVVLASAACTGAPVVAHLPEPGCPPPEQPAAPSGPARQVIQRRRETAVAAVVAADGQLATFHAHAIDLWDLRTR